MSVSVGISPIARLSIRILYCVGTDYVIVAEREKEMDGPLVV